MILALIMAIVLTTAEMQDALQIGALARQELVAFAWLTSPPSGKPYGLRESRYQVMPHHRHAAGYLERVERGEVNRLEIEMPPRHGKSELAVRKFVPWWLGRHPDKSVIVVTHTDTLAKDHGRDVREVLRSPAWRLAFPAKEAELRGDTQAADRLQLRGGGGVTFTGRSGLGAGVGADLMLFDDFFKNTEEAESPTVRDTAWRMFIADCQSRLNNDQAPVVMIGTRRNEDDVQGRLFDPTNPHYDEHEAQRWVRIRLPAMAEDGDPLGREVDTPLWPEKFDRDYYIARRTHRSDIVRIDYQTQDQCHPVPLEGNYFKSRWLTTYEPSELPRHLRHYGASDHAYRKEQKNDRTCLLSIAIDPTDTIWVLPDTWWERAETDAMVDALLRLIATRKPVCWWAARDAISGSLGPFIKKRMREDRTFTYIDDDVREDKDLIRRAQSIRGRMAMGMVRWPRHAPWWVEAEQELLAFPNGKHDDLVAALAVLGMGLDKMVTPSAPTAPQTGLPKAGTLAWVKQVTLVNQSQTRAANEMKGW